MTARRSTRESPMDRTCPWRKAAYPSTLADRTASTHQPMGARFVTDSQRTLAQRRLRDPHLNTHTNLENN
ncbi:hypothetical protein GCM10022234_09270 [Aeromicrobium panaciterrae]